MDNFFPESCFFNEFQDFNAVCWPCITNIWYVAEDFQIDRIQSTTFLSYSFDLISRRSKVAQSMAQFELKLWERALLLKIMFKALVVCITLLCQYKHSAWFEIIEIFAIFELCEELKVMWIWWTQGIGRPGELIIVTKKVGRGEKSRG